MRPTVGWLVVCALSTSGCASAACSTCTHGAASNALALPLLATLTPLVSVAEGVKSDVVKSKKRRPSQKKEDGLQMKSTIGESLRNLWRMRPELAKVKQISLGVALVLMVVCIRYLQNEAKRPRREFGAPRKDDGDGETRRNQNGSKGNKAALAPLARQVRQALDSGAPGGKFGQVRSAAQTMMRFPDEDRESAELSIENRRLLRHALEAASNDGCSGRARCWWGEDCYRKNPDHLKNYAHPGDKDWFAIDRTIKQKKQLQLEVTLAGPSPAALRASASHFESADGYRGGAPVSSVVVYMAHHTGLLQQFLRQVLAKVQKFVHLKPDASVLSPEQFCVVLQACREVARLMEAGATVDDIINGNFRVVHGQDTEPAAKKAN